MRVHLLACVAARVVQTDSAALLPVATPAHALAVVRHGDTQDEEQGCGQPPETDLSRSVVFRVGSGFGPVLCNQKRVDVSGLFTDRV